MKLYIEIDLEHPNVLMPSGHISYRKLLECTSKFLATDLKKYIDKHGKKRGIIEFTKNHGDAVYGYMEEN